MRIFFVSLALFCGLCVGVLAQEVCTPSATETYAGKPFTVQGRLSAWNGAPTHRIWIIGTHRMLGVHAGSPMPDNLLPFTQSFDTQVVGDFVVCPLTRSRPGVMQMVRIVSASGLQVQTRASK